jgi:tRNA (cmo5U34)-methyltransferase
MMAESGCGGSVGRGSSGDPAMAVSQHFADPAAVARYAEGPPRFVPGFDALHRMTAVLLAEGAPADARLLVVGAGGGLEISALAAAQPGWRFVGVDPSAAMLALAAQATAQLGDRVELVEGVVADLPLGGAEATYDGATCLLTLHLLDAEARRRTLEDIRRRMKPGAPLVVAHQSFPQTEPERSLWLMRYAAHAIAAGAAREQAEEAQAAVGALLPTLAPEDDEAILKGAGFADATLFYAAFTWRGWVGHA